MYLKFEIVDFEPGGASSFGLFKSHPRVVRGRFEEPRCAIDANINF